MSFNILSTRVSTLEKNDSIITKTHANTESMKDAFPSIYIESSETISISNTVMTISDNVFSIIGMTIIELVIKIRSYGILAYITKQEVGLLPAELLLDFANESVISRDIDLSPKKLSTIHDKILLNVPALDESSIYREVISVYSKSEDVMYGDSDQRFSFFTESDMLYINGLREDTKAIILYRIDKFFLFASRKNSIELSMALSVESEKINGSLLMETSTALNWNKV